MLGAIIVAGTVADAGGDLPGEDDFDDPRCRAVFRAIGRLRPRLAGIEWGPLVAELEAAGELGLVGGSEGLSSMIDTAGATHDVRHYARVVAQAARRRRRRRAALDVADAEDGPEVDRALAELAAASVGPVSEDPRWLRLSDVEEVEQRWLWDGRIPIGELVQIVGPDGAGKTALAVYLAAKISTGQPLHGNQESSAPRGVVWIGGEEGLGKVKRRLARAGADTSRVVVLAQGQRWATTATGIAELQAQIEHHAVALVVIDPIADAIEGDDWRPRKELRALVGLAHLTGVVVLGLRHWVKQARDARARASGGHAWRDMARASMQVAEHEGRRVIAWDKLSDAQRPAALSFTLSNRDGDPVLEIVGEEARITADEVTLAAPPSAEERSALDDAMEFLRDELEHGERDAQEIRKRARAANVQERTLRRAREQMRVTTRKVRDAYGRVTASMWSKPSAHEAGQMESVRAERPAEVPRVHRRHVSTQQEPGQMAADGLPAPTAVDHGCGEPRGPARVHDVAAAILDAAEGDERLDRIVADDVARDLGIPAAEVAMQINALVVEGRLVARDIAARAGESARLVRAAS